MAQSEIKDIPKLLSEKTNRIRLDAYTALVNLFKHVVINTLIEITTQPIVSSNESPRLLGLPRISFRCLLFFIFLKSFGNIYFNL